MRDYNSGDESVAQDSTLDSVMVVEDEPPYEIFTADQQSEPQHIVEQAEEEFGYIYDEGASGGERPSTVISSDFRFSKSVQYPELMALVGNLNQKQKVILQHCITYLFQQEKFYIFLTGGAGTGKSRVINTLYQVLLKIFNPREIAERLPVLISAYTGKAAYNVKG